MLTARAAWGLAAASVLALAADAPGAAAAELKVVSAGAVRSVLRAMSEDYARRTGHTLRFVFSSTGELRRIIASGEPADLIITAASVMAELEQSGKLAAGSRVDIGRVGMGVVVREGAPVPNVSSPDAVRTVLLEARSIAHTDPRLGGASYVHLMKIAERFGIAERVAAKGVHATGGDDAAAKVAAGQADVAVVLVSEINAKGAVLAGLLPEPLQAWSVYAAAVPATSSQPQLARELIGTLLGPAMREQWRAAGWQPSP